MALAPRKLLATNVIKIILAERSSICFVLRSKPNGVLCFAEQNTYDTPKATRTLRVVALVALTKSG